MDGLLQWETGDGPVVVEVDSRDPGFQSVGRTSGDELITATQPFGEALDRIRGAAVTALRTFRDESLAPDEVSLEFGVKFNATAGAVIAKTSAEGHLTIRLAWSSGPQANTGNGTSAEGLANDK